MDPTDNFSQKKKKDLVAIATLFGVLTEEKANRMTKPELIELLAEQDRVSRPSVNPTSKKSVENDLVRSAEDLSNTVTEPMIEKPKKTSPSGHKQTSEVLTSDTIAEPDQELSQRPVTSSSVSESKVAGKTPDQSKKPRQVPRLATGNTSAKEAATTEVPAPSADSNDFAREEGKIAVSEPKTKGRKSSATRAPARSSSQVPESISGGQADPQSPATSSAKKQKPSDRQKKTRVVAEVPSEAQSIREGLTSRTVEDSAPASGDTNGMPRREVSVPMTNQEPGQDTGRDHGLTESRDADRSMPLEDTPAESAPSFEVKPTESAKPEPVAANQSLERSSSHPRSKHRSVIIKPKNETQGDVTATTDAQEQPESEQPSSEDDTTQEHRAHRSERSKESNQEFLSGVLEILQEGYGFLRRENYLQGQNDIFVAAQYIRRFNLRVGDYVSGPCRPRREGERYQALQYIKEVNGLPPEKMIRRATFDRLTPIYPDEKYILETEKIELSTRIIDLIAPIGKGQRGMIVSPPKAGKTILLQKIANAISINNPESKLIVLLIDERPEEVTDMQRSINGEVVFSTFDKTPENHVKITELVLERAMRLVELGQDVVILLDSITRMSRAYNLTINPTGRTLSGGLDPGALYGPKRFFGAARNIENGGSLTIIATSLIDTGSRMDEVIFEEFKGTGNMEVYLDRKLSEKRIFPAIDINKSGTRREELLLSQLELDAVWTIRKALGQLDTAAVTEMIISLLLKTTGNSQFVSSVNVSFNDKATFEAMRGTRLTGNGSSQGAGQQGGK